MKTATVAVEQKEDAMKVLSVAELICLTRSELLELACSLELQVKELPANSSEFRDSLCTLFNVRAVLIGKARQPFNVRPRPPAP